MTNAVKAAVNGISACAPVDSGVPVTLNVCAGEQTIWLAFINQIKVAFCYIFGLLTDIQAEIAAIPTMRTPGTINITVGSGAGAGASVSTSGNDTAGQITLITGTGTSTGTLFTISNNTPYSTAGILHLESANVASSGTIPNTTTNVNGSVAAFTGAIGDSATYIWNYVVLGGT